MSDRVPNNLPEGAAPYWREYVEAGGADHAATAYARACAARDGAMSKLNAIVADDGPFDVSKSQAVMALNKVRADASATAEKLRAALPTETADNDDPDGHFDD